MSLNFSFSFALPGVAQSIPDSSGQFVYYRDYSFERESYFGAVFFDDGTYGVRYFAPAVTNTYPMQPKKDIYILFSLDSQKKYIELTGEKILTPVSPSDTDLINYLHDMLYELTSRRQKAGIIEFSCTIENDYDQFGGLVQIEFDPFIPLFNIKNIKDKENKTVFKLITLGQLTSSNDDSFSAFEGLPLKIQDTEHSLKLTRSAKRTTIEFSKTSEHTQKINLDSQWTASAENLYTLSNSAILVFDIINTSTMSESEQNQFYNNLIRKINLGKEASYPYYEVQRVEKTKNSQKFTNIFYNDLSKSFTKDYKIFTTLKDNSIAVLTLTVFYGAYSANSKYFESILKSYSAN